MRCAARADLPSLGDTPTLETLGRIRELHAEIAALATLAHDRGDHAAFGRWAAFRDVLAAQLARGVRP